MKQSRLRNKFLNTKSKIRKHITTNITIALLFLRKTKLTFFGSIYITDVTHNKTFCETVKHSSQIKFETRSKITLIEKRRTEKDKEELMIITYLKL